MRAMRELVLGETVALPVGVALVLVVGLALEALGGSWWEDDGGFVLLALVVAVLAVSLAPAHRRRS
jgi:membrane protein implicated in regulation of membrane protease activity